MRYTLRQLEYSSRLAKLGWRQSEFTFLSPRFSTAIADLKRELGIQLFIRRHAQGLPLTPIRRSVLFEETLRA